MTDIRQMVLEHGEVSARHASMCLVMSSLDADGLSELSGLEAEMNRFAELVQQRRILNLCGAGYTLGDVLVHPDFDARAVVGLGDQVTLDLEEGKVTMPIMEATRRLAAATGRGPAVGDWNRDGVRLGGLECWGPRSPAWSRSRRVPIEVVNGTAVTQDAQLGLFG